MALIEFMTARFLLYKIPNSIFTLYIVLMDLLVRVALDAFHGVARVGRRRRPRPFRTKPAVAAP